MMDGNIKMPARLSLGPVLFNWQPERWRDFYFRIADETEIASVHLGEVVCSKRQPFFAPHLPAVIDRLQAAGKEVVLSSLALVMTDQERQAVRALADRGDDLLIEANDIALASLLVGRPHMIGPFVNVYNEGSLACLAERGAIRVCLPTELPASTVAYLAGQRICEIEVQVFGRLPLAVSARCYHARAHGLHKDGCQYVCGQDPDGLPVDTMDGISFLTVNGTQTMSSRYMNLLGQLDALRQAGVGYFRLWPQDCDMGTVSRLFGEVLNGKTDATEANRRLEELLPHVEFANGYAFGREGHAFVSGTDAATLL